MKRLLVALVLLFTLLSAGPAFAADEPTTGSSSAARC